MFVEPFLILLLDTLVRLLLNPFRLWFDSLFRVLFTFPSRYFFSIGFLIIFSLGSNSRPFFRQHYKADLLFWNKKILSLRSSSIKNSKQDFHPLWLYTWTQLFFYKKQARFVHTAVPAEKNF